MKPNFALHFTDDSIALLHRTRRGWAEIGSTPFDTDDLPAALDALRQKAEALEPSGITTKLVIPNSQIKYIEVQAPGPDAAKRRAQIAVALEGQTPYDVADLVWDHWGKGPAVQVAVLARETLDEAEGFAAAHGFNPVSFVAIPDDPAYAGEPWFGPSSHSTSLLKPGEKVERDQDPIRLASAPFPATPEASPSAEDAATDPVDDPIVPPETDRAEPAPDTTKPAAAEAPPAEATPAVAAIPDAAPSEAGAPDATPSEPVAASAPDAAVQPPPEPQPTDPLSAPSGADEGLTPGPNAGALADDLFAVTRIETPLSDTPIATPPRLHPPQRRQWARQPWTRPPSQPPLRPANPRPPSLAARSPTWTRRPWPSTFRKKRSTTAPRSVAARPPS